MEEEGFPPEDIVFGANVFAVATSIEEHERYAIQFIEAVRRIKAECPRAHERRHQQRVFLLRGSPEIRRCAAFLYHAIAAGLDMGIVDTNAAGSTTRFRARSSGRSKTCCSRVGRTRPRS